MNNIKHLAIIAAALTLSASSVSAKSPKRGLSENQFSISGQMAPLAPGVTWYYNWANTPGTGYQNQVINFTEFEFVPMCWNDQYDADKIRNYCATHPNTKYILGFNEPNFVAQANMTPAKAAEKWPALKALANELNLKIVGPAVNYSPDGPENDPYTWYTEFYRLVGADAFDFVGIHCYGGAGLAKTMVNRFYEMFGKQCWLTEFCYWPGGAGNVYVAPDTQISSMIETLEFLEKSDKVFRYSWFKAIGDHNASNKPNYGLIINQNGLGDRQLSQQGWVYTYLTDFDITRFHPTETVIAASEYISQPGGMLLDKGANEACPSPIEISRFQSGIYVDYQFDIPKESDYTLSLEVSGVGEPTRFNPSVAIYSVNENGTQGTQLCEAVQFPLSGSNDAYTIQNFNLHLAAGKQTIRVKDANPSQPSGIRISTIKISDQAGVESTIGDNIAITYALGRIIASGTEVSDMKVFDLNGRCVAQDNNSEIDAVNLSSGIYIVKTTTASNEIITKKITINNH